MGRLDMIHLEDGKMEVGRNGKTIGCREGRAGVLKYRKVLKG